ncbi:DUF4870 domain-containing protein [Nocardiopsis kunsanensis]|uniref:DUF4870 domain-containing protein n=1 Tax=Nocardiopsis kunsanensis TaxID=141693 RepID=A0A918X5X7_9ACTN|nr:DUF4870 domain-containing protein [Nocardiopsis kunsanensis]GHD14569.1 hypothetical protein GCM10007147_00740 [Nocardiopsis kunsanensis]
MSYPHPPPGHGGQGWQHNGGMPPQGGTGGYPPPPAQAPGGYPPPPAQAPGGYPPPHSGGQQPQSGGYGPPPAAGDHPGGQGMPPAGYQQGNMPVPYGQGPGMPSPHQGQAWGAPYGQGGDMYGYGHPTPPECDSAKVAHIGAIFGWLVALIMYLLKKDESPYVRYHTAQALNFQLLMLIGYFISGVLMFVLIGYLTWMALFITSIVLQIKAAGAAGRGEWYRFPFNVNWVS